jgi:hypothetical protein
MRRPRSASPEEIGLWRATIRDVTPLGRRPAAVDPPGAATTPPPLAAPAAGLPAQPPPGGIDRQILKTLAKGDRKIDAVIDLHGLTLAAAHQALGRFIGIQAAAGRRCLLVITGKGRQDRPGRLRREVPTWLEGWRPPVLAITPARPRDGGEGAFYVLLRRRR